MTKLDFHEFLIKINSIAKIGLLYSKDPYALENYEEIRSLSTTMIEKFNEVNLERPTYFTKNVYPTPNISVRTLIRDEKGRLLLVKEADSGTYSVPGGWCDIYDSPSEAAKREVLQESGYVVEIIRLVGILDRERDQKKNDLSEYAIWFEGRIVSSTGTHCHETTEVSFFDMDALPSLSWKMPNQDFARIINALKNHETIFD